MQQCTNMAGWLAAQSTNGDERQEHDEGGFVKLPLFLCNGGAVVYDKMCFIMALVLKKRE